MAQRGILNLEQAQIIFVDTPGIHDPRTKLGSFMVEQARRAIPDADVICFVVDRVDSILGALIAVSVVVPTPPMMWAYVLLIGPGIHLVFSALLYRLGVKARAA